MRKHPYYKGIAAFLTICLAKSALGAISVTPHTMQGTIELSWEIGVLTETTSQGEVFKVHRTSPVTLSSV